MYFLTYQGFFIHERNEWICWGYASRHFMDIRRTGCLVDLRREEDEE